MGVRRKAVIITVQRRVGGVYVLGFQTMAFMIKPVGGYDFGVTAPNRWLRHSPHAGGRKQDNVFR